MGDEEECILITAFALGFYNLCASDCMRKGRGILWDVAQTEEYRQVEMPTPSSYIMAAKSFDVANSWTE